MSVTWRWNEIAGHVLVNDLTTKENYELTLWEGNTYLFAMIEMNDGWHMCWFFNDRNHCKRCLGLVRGEENIFADRHEFTYMNLHYDRLRDAYDIGKLFQKAFPDLTVCINHSKYETKKICTDRE